MTTSETPSEELDPQRSGSQSPAPAIESSAKTDAPPGSVTAPASASDDEGENSVEFHALEDMDGAATFKRYNIARLLDEGGMGKIHIARDLNLRRRVVIKELKHGQSADAIHDFVREAQITAQLDHPNIVPVYNVMDPKRSGGAFAFTMKLVEGETWEQIIEGARRRFFDDPTAARTHELERGLRERLEQFINVCRAMEYAHSRGVIHRDLKPANIMVGAHGETYVMDWGLAYSPNIGVTEPPETLAGTPRYMAPEQMKGDARILKADTDVFALGLLLFELITLKRATKGEGIEELILSIPKGQFNDFTHYDPKISIHPDLAAIVNRAIQVQRRFRYQSASALAQDLGSYIRDEEVSVRPDNTFRKIARWVGRHRVGALITLLMVFVLASGLTIWGFASAQAVAEERKTVAEQQKTVAEQQKRIAEQEKRIADEKRISVEQEKVQLQSSRVREAQISRFQSEISARAYSIDEQFARSEDQVRALADAARLLLAHPQRKKLSLYSHVDYEAPETSPPDAVFSPIYKKEVSLEQTVYKLAPGTQWRKVKKQLRRLAPLNQHFLRMLLHSGDLSRRDRPPLASRASLAVSRDEIRRRILVEGVPVRWAFIGLESGVILAYPGKSGYKPDYDPRERPWYKLAANTHGIHWGKLYEDAQGQGLLMPCVSAVYDQNESFVGVVALEITLNDVIEYYIKREGEGFIEAYIITPDGNIIVRTGEQNAAVESGAGKEDFVEGALFHDPALLEAIKAQPSGIVYSEDAERKIITGYQHLTALGWIYVEEVEASSVLKERGSP